MAEKTLVDLETRLDNLFKKAPSLPAEIIGLIVDYGPYLALISGALGLFSILSAGFRLGVFFGPLGLVGLSLVNYYLQIILNIIASVILILSFKPLKEKKYRGWQMLFYLTLIYAVFAIFLFNLGGLVGVILSFYILFQIRGKYS